MHPTEVIKRLLVKRRGWFASIGLILLTIGIYWPGLHGPFVFDDLTNIGLVEALRIESLDFRSLLNAAFWQKTDIGSGRPVAMLSFAINYYIAGLDSFGYKITNLCIHLANGLVLWFLTIRLLQRIGSSDRKRGKPSKSADNHKILAFAVVSLWLLHPLNLTSVLYVVQRMTSLASLFILLGLLSYTLGRDQLAKGKRIGFVTAGGGIAIFGILALLTKEIGLLLPLYALVIEIVCYRFAAKEPMKHGIRTLWALFGVAVVVAAVVKFDLIAKAFNYQYREFTPSERLLTEARVIWFYIKLIFIPSNSDLGIYHDDIPLSHGLFSPPSTVFAVVGVFGLLIAAVAAYRRAPILSLGIGWFLAGHTLESSLLPLELVHEHRNYLPQYGLLIAFLYYVLTPFGNLRRTLPMRRAFVALSLALFGTITFARSLDWKDEWTLYNSEVMNHPDSASARTMLAVILHDNHQDALAHEQFAAAAALRPNDSRTILRLVQHTYLTTGSVPEPLLEELEHRLRTNPYSNNTLWIFEPLLRNTTPSPKLNRRLIRLYEALVHRTDVELPFGWKEHALRTLGFAYRDAGDYRVALTYFTRAAEHSTAPANHLLAGLMHIKLNQTKEAARMADLVRPHRDTLNNTDRARLETLEAALANSTKPATRGTQAPEKDK